ncbi:UNVERIFIED_CONTAM: hypothetical protein PYX00_011117 [Menopon gallinae]|uniref:Autotransporter domain-containing protein n=1 Tax=Menopon gallinae TaxID=328185 RepID=A0AAW2H5Z8_9NEOP
MSFEGSAGDTSIFVNDNINQDMSFKAKQDPLSGRISLNEEGSDSICLIAAQGIHTIDLGDGDHQLDISTIATGTSWKAINGGAGKNSISFAKMLSGIKYDLHKAIRGGGTSIAITNFDGVTAIQSVKDNISSSTEKLTIDLSDLPITGSPVYVKMSFASKDITFALSQVENVYFLVRAKNDDGSYVRGRGFHVVDTHRGSYKLSLFMHKDATVITKSDFGGSDRPIALVAKQGSLAALDATSRIERIALSYEIDFKSYQYLNGQTIYINPRIEQVVLPSEHLRNFTYKKYSNRIVFYDKNDTDKKIIIEANTTYIKFKEVPKDEMNQYLIDNNHFFDMMKENPNEGITYDSNGSVYKLGNTLWISENKYLENLNKDSSTSEYWKNLDNRIDNALKEEGRYARDVYNKEKVNEDSNNNKENYPEEEPQLIWDEEMELENNNSNHNFENDIDKPEEDIILKDELNNETEETKYIAEESNSEDLNLDTENNVTNNNSYEGGFDLNAVLESAKEMGKADNNSNILDELGANNISSEVLENMYQVDEANSMAYTIDTVVLASFLLTGAAKAADVYKDEFNTLTINVKAQAYVTHDYYGFKDTAKGRSVAPAELDGKVQVDTYYFRMYNDKLTANAYVRLDIPTFGYSQGPYGHSYATDKNLALSTFGFINKAYGQMTYKDIGTLTFGRYKGFYSHIIDYSDVDIFVGTPAHNTKNSVFFGGSPETGIAYHGVFANESLIVGISADAGKDSVPYFVTSDRKGLNFKKDYKGSAMVQYNIYDGLKVGAAYNITGFRVNSGVEAAQQNDLDRQRAQNIIGGINYNKGRTNIGITGSYQFYRYNVNANDMMKNQSYGVEAGITYDISGMGVGFRPSAQFDFRKSYNELKTKNVDGSFTVDKKDYITVQALEVGLSYYVTPNLYYQGAAVLDLRTKARIAKADGVDTNKDKATPHHYFGLGVVYKF